MKETLNQTIDYLNHMKNGKKINTEKLMDIVTLIKEQRNYFIEDLPEININQNIPQQELKENLLKTMRNDPEILRINDLQKTSYIGSRNVKIYLEHDPFYLLRG